MVVPLPTKVSINISSVYFFILGSPIPAPKPRARTLSGAVEYPSFIARASGDFNDKMHLLMEYAGRLEQEVADPWYTDYFDATWRDVLAGCQGLLDQIIAQGV